MYAYSVFYIVTFRTSDTRAGLDHLKVPLLTVTQVAQSMNRLLPIGAEDGNIESHVHSTLVSLALSMAEVPGTRPQTSFSSQVPVIAGELEGLDFKHAAATERVGTNAGGRSHSSWRISDSAVSSPPSRSRQVPHYSLPAARRTSTCSRPQTTSSGSSSASRTAESSVFCPSNSTYAMATSGSLLGFFTQMSNMNGVIVKDQPKLDLDLYLQNYTGRTRYDRLILIGKCSVPLCVDALKTAVTEAKAGTDVSRYREAWDYIRVAAPNEPEAQRDDAWIESAERANKAETARLETELKGYKNNLIKESIRMGNEDLGRHFENIGFLNEAAEAYSRMRQDVSTTKHIIDCGMHLVSVSLQRRDWAMVLNNLGKITGVQSGEDDKSSQAYTKIVSGIALLGLGHYQDAAKSFLLTDFSVPSTTHSHIASPNDVAIYGGLLALATMERKDLQTLRNDYMLDIYLQRHITAIYAQIRSKSIVQYFVPFSCVTLDSMNEAFAQEGESIEDELVAMIREGTLKARLDAKNKLLIAVVPDPRLEMQKNALEVARQYEQEAKERLRRMSLMAAGLEVAGSKKQHGGQGRAGIDEAWYDDAKALPSGVEAQD
ncbi:hypothetical protein G7Z17_g11237 [Cylindrodendrum hubeiense]|uniref:PCI domain-containing protein n=1 Tax=Cylindrodendrum hubeiense TaxID=595255 RepID=A0A9P5LBI4_9HYPO|nr:hypothetical protein G7Z17_g11237 [Cylindrodendrum hubeiense]